MSQINIATLFLGPLLHVWSLSALLKPQTLTKNIFRLTPIQSNVKIKLLKLLEQFLKMKFLP